MVAQIDLLFVKARPWKTWPRLLAYTLFEGRPLTTRGRWLNPIVFAGYRLWPRLPLKKPNPEPVFILGVGRSGTTVLGTILAMHRDVGYLNEPKALWHAALGDDDVIGSYAENAGRFRMSGADATAPKIHRLHSYYRAFQALAGCRRVVDKYPELLFRTGFLDAVFPKNKQLVLIRNGLDICSSIEKWSQRHGKTAGRHSDDWWGRDQQKWQILLDELVAPDPAFRQSLGAIRKFRRHVDMAAVEWIVSMRAAQRLQSTNGRELLFVRYEDLLADPAGEMAAILTHCGLRTDAKMMQFAQDRLRPQSAHGAVALHPAIQELFNQTMVTLGYQQRHAA